MDLQRTVPVVRSYQVSRRLELGSYSLTFRICPPGQRLSAPLVPLERFAIRFKKRGIANQAIRIEPTTQNSKALPLAASHRRTALKRQRENRFARFAN